MTEVKNLDKAAIRIKQAVKNKENIVLFSDADLDGVASLIILEESIKSLGGKVSLAYFPNRETQGYGLTEVVLEDIKSYAPGLLILSDSGVTTFKEIKIAKEMGFSVIVVDHHEILNNKLPEADIIIDPKQESDSYPFKLMAACGLCFRLAEKIIGDSEDTKSLRQGFVELAALGTISDMMPKEYDNQEIIQQGLYHLANSQRPGLKVLIDIFEGEQLASSELASKIISVLQLTDFEKNHTESYLLLTKGEEVEVAKLARLLIEKSLNRHSLIKELVRETKQECEQENSCIVFNGGNGIPHLLTGNIASKLCNRLKKPCFIYAGKNGVSRGSVRMPKGINGVEALNHCKDLLDVYGGHPQAAGFTIKNENLEKFKGCLTKYFESNH